MAQTVMPRPHGMPPPHLGRAALGGPGGGGVGSRSPACGDLQGGREGGRGPPSHDESPAQVTNGTSMSFPTRPPSPRSSTGSCTGRARPVRTAACDIPATAGVQRSVPAEVLRFLITEESPTATPHLAPPVDDTGPPRERPSVPGRSQQRRSGHARSRYPGGDPSARRAMWTPALSSAPVIFSARDRRALSHCRRRTSAGPRRTRNVRGRR